MLTLGHEHIHSCSLHSKICRQLCQACKCCDMQVQSQPGAQSLQSRFVQELCLSLVCADTTQQSAVQVRAAAGLLIAWYQQVLGAGPVVRAAVGVLAAAVLMTKVLSPVLLSSPHHLITISPVVRNCSAWCLQYDAQHTGACRNNWSPLMQRQLCIPNGRSAGLM